jgi:hypothetical protein
MSAPFNRPVTTHIVLAGRLKYNAYLDDDTLRDISDGAVVARRKQGSWNRPVATAKPPNPNAVGRGKWDDVRPLGPAVQVQLSKGRFY